MGFVGWAGDRVVPFTSQRLTKEVDPREPMAGGFFFLLAFLAESSRADFSAALSSFRAVVFAGPSSSSSSGDSKLMVGIRSMALAGPPLPGKDNTPKTAGA